MLQDLEIHYQLDSTNRFLRDRLTIGTIQANVVFAEYQTDGRGRGSNQWLTAPASGLCLSIGWHFDSTPRNLSALSLATGVVLAECLAQFGSQPVRLKWPNDLVYSGAKLGGILIESRGQLGGTVDVIIGIGINVEMPSGFAKGIAQDVTDLKHVYGYCPSRNLLAGCIINGMFRLLDSYARRGFEAYMEKWRELDITRDRMVVLHQATGDVAGRVVDIDENGFLILSVNGTLSRYSSGDLSLRMAT
jgi:BirA family transcriptional regulator, biotin operon repressor / biotin---[acetyl-CoA-carboxylase] ligase